MRIREGVRRTLLRGDVEDPYDQRPVGAVQEGPDPVGG